MKRAFIAAVAMFVTVSFGSMVFAGEAAKTAEPAKAAAATETKTEKKAEGEKTEKKATKKKAAKKKAEKKEGEEKKAEGAAAPAPAAK